MTQSQKLRDVVEDMLLDAGEEDSAELRDALMSLGSLASLPVPAPNAQLAALLAAPQDELTRRRGLRRHRTTIVGLAVVAGMGLGATGVAASSDGLGDPAHPPIQHLLQEWAPAWSVTGLALLTADGLLPEPDAGNQPDPASVPASGYGEGSGERGAGVDGGGVDGAGQDAAGADGAAQPGTGPDGAGGNGQPGNGQPEDGQGQGGPAGENAAGGNPAGENAAGESPAADTAGKADGAQGGTGNASPHGSAAADSGVDVPGTLADPLARDSGAQQILPPAAPVPAGSGSPNKADSSAGLAARLLRLQGR